MFGCFEVRPLYYALRVIGQVIYVNRRISDQESRGQRRFSSHLKILDLVGYVVDKRFIS